MKYGVDEAVEILTPLIKNQKLAIFVGSGVSADAGLPKWDDLIDKFIQFCEELQESLEEKYQFKDVIKEIKKQRKTNAIRVSSVLKDLLYKVDENSLINVKAMLFNHEKLSGQKAA